MWGKIKYTSGHGLTTWELIDSSNIFWHHAPLDGTHVIYLKCQAFFLWNSNNGSIWLWATWSPLNGLGITIVEGRWLLSPSANHNRNFGDKGEREIQWNKYQAFSNFLPVDNVLFIFATCRYYPTVFSIICFILLVQEYHRNEVKQQLL